MTIKNYIPQLKNSITVLSSVILLTVGLNASTVEPLKKVDNSNIKKQNNVREGIILYKLKDSIHPKDLKKFNSLVNKTNLLSKKDIKGLKISIAKIKGIYGQEQSFAKKLQDTGAVEFAEADALVEHNAVPNDQYYSLQWHHQNISSEQAWDISTGSSDVKVCVIDTGVDTDHPDLVNNLLLPGYNAYYDMNGNVEDLYGHGTGTSGVIAAQGNNGYGVSGVNWNVKIMPVQVSQGTITSSAYISDMAEGISWCADNGAKIANLSYGGIQYETINQAATYLRNKGGLLFMSSGNSGAYHDSISFPDYTSFVAVGATNSSDLKSSFSEYGPYIDLVAGGEDIATTYLNSDYVYYSGTSFSSPMAAGAGALLLSINPNLTPDQLENYLFTTATDLGTLGEDDYYGHGRINLAAAANAVYNDLGSNPAPEPEPTNEVPISIASADITSGYAPLNVTFNGTSSYDNDGSIVNYTWDFGDGTTSNSVVTNHVYNNPGTYNAKLKVEDDKGATSTSNSIVINVTEFYNNPPILNLYVDNIMGEAPLTVNVNSSQSYDIDGTITDYIVNFGNGTTLNGSNVSYTYTVPGTYQLVVKIVDNYGAITTSSPITVTVAEPYNNPPIAQGFINKTYVDIGEEISFDATSSYDVDGSIVRYTWHLGNGEVLNNAFATYAYPQAGTYNVYLEVEDNENSVTKTNSVQIVVKEAIDPTIDNPTNLVYVVDGSSVILNWEHSLKPYSAFDVYRAEKARGKYIYKLISTTSTNTYTDINVKEGSYKYKIIARNTYSNVSSSYSNEISVIVEASTTSPEPGVDNTIPVLSATLSGKTVTLNIDYTCPSGESCLFEIQRGVKSGKTISWSPFVTTNIKTISINESSGTYYYQVRVNKDSGTTNFSEIVKVRIR